jgi:hypothetical protein
MQALAAIEALDILGNGIASFGLICKLAMPHQLVLQSNIGSGKY